MDLRARIDVAKEGDVYLYFFQPEPDERLAYISVAAEPDEDGTITTIESIDGTIAVVSDLRDTIIRIEKFMNRAAADGR